MKQIVLLIFFATLGTFICTACADQKNELQPDAETKTITATTTPDMVDASNAEKPVLGTGGSILDEARWEARLLLICGDREAALGTKLQEDQFGRLDWSGYLERDLVVVGVSPGASIVFDTSSFASELENPSVHVWNDGDIELEKISICSMGQPAVTLIGKDGGVKGRWSSPVSNEDLFARIDSMPMRQREQRDKQK